MVAQYIMLILIYYECPKHEQTHRDEIRRRRRTHRRLRTAVQDDRSVNL